MPKPSCPSCQRFHRPELNGIWVIECAPEGGAPPGKHFACRWKPYKIWQADKWKCQGCGHEVITGYGLEPLSVRHKADFDEMLAFARRGDHVYINDC